MEKFTVTDDEAKFFNLRCLISRSRRTIRPGTYTRLTRNGQVIMSDTPAEILDHREPIYVAKGNILINGLGIGYVVQECLKKEDVKFVTCVEISEDVISLVADHYLKMFPDRLEIIHADALDWKPPKGKRYDLVWNDIWDNICGDNWETMKKLHIKYGRRSDWIGSWCRYEVKKSNKKRAY